MVPCFSFFLCLFQNQVPGVYLSGGCTYHYCGNFYKNFEVNGVIQRARRFRGFKHTPVFFCLDFILFLVWCKLLLLPSLIVLPSPSPALGLPSVGTPLDGKTKRNGMKRSRLFSSFQWQAPPSTVDCKQSS